MLSVTVDRTTLALTPLVIGSDPSAGLWIPEGGLGRIGTTWRRTRVGSPFTNRSVQTRAVLDDDTIPLSVYAQAASSAALDTLKDEVEAAFYQWAYDLTVTEDGVAKVFSVDCADVKWNDYDSGMTSAFLAQGSLSIPVGA